MRSRSLIRYKKCNGFYLPTNEKCQLLFQISGVDPKSVFCQFFKQGLCKKGDKCKFSHDPACERKAAKINVYSDARFAH